MPDYSWLRLTPYESRQLVMGQDYPVRLETSEAMQISDILTMEGIMTGLECFSGCCGSCGCGCQKGLEVEAEANCFRRGPRFQEIHAIDGFDRDMSGLSSTGSGVSAAPSSLNPPTRNGPFVAPSMRYLDESPANRTNAEIWSQRQAEIQQLIIDENPFRFFISTPEYDDEFVDEDTVDDTGVFGPPELTDSMSVNVALSNSEMSRLSQYSASFQHNADHDALNGVGDFAHDYVGPFSPFST